MATRWIKLSLWNLKYLFGLHKKKEKESGSNTTDGSNTLTKQLLQQQLPPITSLRLVQFVWDYTGDVVTLTSADASHQLQRIRCIVCKGDLLVQLLAPPNTKVLATYSYVVIYS
eukprot:1195054-Prorocentrum_minimum.AAC.1